jgi:hypothetical protein
MHWLFQLYCLSFLAIVNTVALSQNYREFKPVLSTLKQNDTNNFSLLPQYVYKIDTNHYIAIGNKKPDTNGKCLFYIESIDEETNMIFTSSGSKESYIMIPYFYRCPNANAPEIILTELGTEYSWGLRIFLKDHLRISDIGIIPVYIDGAHGTSIQTHLSIKYSDQKILFRFDENFDRHDDSMNITYKHKKWQYLYTNGTLIFKNR